MIAAYLALAIAVLYALAWCGTHSRITIPTRSASVLEIGAMWIGAFSLGLRLYIGAFAFALKRGARVEVEAGWIVFYVYLWRHPLRPGWLGPTP